MIFIRTIRSHRIPRLLISPNPLPSSPHSTRRCDDLKTRLSYSFFVRPLSVSPQLKNEIDADSVSSASDREAVAMAKKPLYVLFEEAVGLRDTGPEKESEIGKGDKELIEKLRKLEAEVRALEENANDKGKVNDPNARMDRETAASAGEAKRHGSLYALFAKEVVNRGENPRVDSSRVQEPVISKELPFEMVEFAKFLYRKGYLSEANFVKNEGVDVHALEDRYARDFLKFAGEKFGKDNHEVFGLLSDNHLRKVAEFGCPSVTRKNVFAAKALRIHFRIKEETVCSRCPLKRSCKFVNQRLLKSGPKDVGLATVMRVITPYALESVSPHLAVPEEVSDCVHQLLKEIRGLCSSDNPGPLANCEPDAKR